MLQLTWLCFIRAMSARSCLYSNACTVAPGRQLLYGSSCAVAPVRLRSCEKNITPLLHNCRRAGMQSVRNGFIRVAKRQCKKLLTFVVRKVHRILNCVVKQVTKIHVKDNYSAESCNCTKWNGSFLLFTFSQNGTYVGDNFTTYALYTHKDE